MKTSMTMRNILLAGILLLPVMMTGCASSRVSYEPTEEEMLTQKEKYHLFDYARGFIHSSKNIKLSKRDLEVIDSSDPEIRVVYTAPKTGRMSLSWLLPGKVQFIVSAEGPLNLESRDGAVWSFKKVNYARKKSLDPAEFGIVDER